MAITAFGSATSPSSDNNPSAGPTIAVVPPASMVTGDLVIMMGQYSGAVTLTVSQAGGQSWTSETAYTANGLTCRIFWCRYNGTWGANPSVTNTTGTNALTVYLLVLRPTTGAKLWAVDNSVSAAFAAPGSPYTVTIAAFTTTNASTGIIALWHSAGGNTWASFSGTGWTDAGYVRNTTTPVQNTNLAYQIRTTAGTTNAASLNEAVAGPYAGITLAMAWYEYDAGGATPSRLMMLGVG